jgi:hypothetical protein
MPPRPCVYIFLSPPYHTIVENRIAPSSLRIDSLPRGLSLLVCSPFVAVPFLLSLCVLFFCHQFYAASVCRYNGISLTALFSTYILHKINGF